MLDEGQVFLLAKRHIVLTKRGRDMHDTRTALRRHKICTVNFPTVGMVFNSCIIRIIIKNRFVGFADEVGAFESFFNIVREIWPNNFL